MMQPTNTDDPDYYHKVVDCQWACPAHTNVPEYIRLIAQGRYAVSRAPNLVLLERSGFSKDEIENIYRAIRIVTKGNRTMEEALADIAKDCTPSDHIKYLTDFIKNSERGIAR